MDDKWQNLKIDIEDELKSRERRLDRKSSPFDSLTVPQAIVFAAIIIVGGGWAGKLVYDEIQARKAAAAIEQFSQELQTIFRAPNRPAFPNTNRLMQEQQAEINARKNAQEIAKATAQARLEKRLASDECQFWLRMDNQQSTSRTQAKRKEYCTIN